MYIYIYIRICTYIYIYISIVEFPKTGGLKTDPNILESLLQGLPKRAPNNWNPPNMALRWLQSQRGVLRLEFGSRMECVRAR